MNDADFLYCDEVLEDDCKSGLESSQTTLSDSNASSSSPARSRYVRKIGPRKTIVKKSSKKNNLVSTTPVEHGPVETIVTVDTPPSMEMVLEMTPFNVDDFFA